MLWLERDKVMIYTKYRTQLLEDMVQEVRKSVAEQPTTDHVIRAAYKGMTHEECKCITEYFQRKGFETTWFLNDKDVPVIIVSWGIPHAIEYINNRYKQAIAAVGEDIEMIKKLVAEYLSIVYNRSDKNICVIPVKYIEYICDSHAKGFDYMVFRRTLHELEYYYSLRAYQYAFDDDSWAVDYLSIQKKEQNG